VSKDKPTNLAASIRQKLLNLAHERKEEFQLVLVRYGLERLLYRLSQSKHRNQFVLKGAMLFQLWTGQSHRATLDLDLLGFGDDTVARFEAIFREVGEQAVEDDGLRFAVKDFHGEEIREDQRYAGVRIIGTAMLGTARIPIQIDIGFGDAITPKPQPATYPSLLGMPAAQLPAYPKETVIAEKFEAMVSLGIANSRMKDFYDIWIISTTFEFEGWLLAKAVQATFERRGTVIPSAPPMALTPEFGNDAAKQQQWRAFIAKGRLLVAAPALAEVTNHLATFLWPVTQAIVQKQVFRGTWPQGGGWR
jgi:predicted nucleotidyltransferase component of viral defense system